MDTTRSLHHLAATAVTVRLLSLKLYNLVKLNSYKYYKCDIRSNSRNEGKEKRQSRKSEPLPFFFCPGPVEVGDFLFWLVIFFGLVLSLKLHIESRTFAGIVSVHLFCACHFHHAWVVSYDTVSPTVANTLKCNFF